MKKSHYRADIDGLRAIAVIGVILFHANLGFKGGFVGVDVFFVISGFLITGIIAREVREQRFSLRDFWVRRIRRILPAASVVVLTTFIVGMIVLEPSALTQLGKSGLAYSLMMANVFFWQSSGYFSESADLQPLLHTWSLSIEEQFYLVLPLLLAFLLRKKPNWVLPLLSAALVSSFVANVAYLDDAPSAVFYLLPFRAWELLAGSLLALAADRLKFGKLANEALSISGLVAILIAMLVYTADTPFPGFYGVLPVCGAVLFIASNTHQKTFAGKLVSQKILVLVGLMSYSLYLWHWPVLAFCRHIFIEPSTIVICSALILSVLLSFLSWRFIETPFRKSNRLQRPANAYVFGVTSTVIVCGTAIFFWMKTGLPERFSDQELVVVNDITWAGTEYATNNVPGIPIGESVEQLSSPKYDFALWGDSHGMAVAALVDDLAKKHSLRGKALLTGGRPPVTGLWSPLKGADRATSTPAINQARLDWIIKSKIKHVILVARWKSMIDGIRDTEVDEWAGKPRERSMVVDSNVLPSVESSSKAMSRQLTEMINQFDNHDVKVWLILQSPVASRPQVARDFYLKHRFPLFNKDSFQFDTPRVDYEANRQRILELMTAIESENLEIVDPISHVYRDKELLQLYGDRSYYRDEDHLTRAGAEFFYNNMFDEILTKIKPKLSQ